MIHVALTGNIAAGKSTVAEHFRRWGATLIDADDLTRQAQAPGSRVLREIAARFGADVIAPDGALDRARLRARVMEDPKERRALEAIVHPAVQAARAAALAVAQQRGDRIVVSDIPLLFEVLDPASFGAVVLVDAPEAERRTRIRARGLDDASTDAMMAAQLSSAGKRAWRGGPDNRGVLLIENGGDLAALERRTREVWEQLVQLEGGSGQGP